MRKSFSFRRAIWLVEFLLHVKEATLAEITSAWCCTGYGDNTEITRQAWGRHIDEIADTFGIDIECSQRGSHDAMYYISNPEVVRSNKIIRWMINCLHTKLFLLDCLDLADRIVLEDFPSENGCLTYFKDAMKNNLKVKFLYRPYGKPEFHHRTISPYALKTYKNRFYVLGRFDSGRFCMFSFDRMKELQLTELEFDMPEGFNAEEFFSPFYGVFVCKDGLKLEHVVIRAYDDAPNYLRDVPLHHSQKELSASEVYADFQYTIYPTKDFRGAILQQADRLEVLEPIWLREAMKETISKMAVRYAV